MLMADHFFSEEATMTVLRGSRRTMMMMMMMRSTMSIVCIAALANAFSTSRSYHHHHHHRRTTGSSTSLVLLGTKTNTDKLSKQEQEDLWQSNAAYFDTNESTAKHSTSNRWPRSSLGRKLRKQAARPYLSGVEIRLLDAPHPLAGEAGLFAAQPFESFDIVGEYCGVVYDNEWGGIYATYLEHRDNKYALVVDARVQGNECRFINHFQGISKEPNVVMKVAYVEELPRVMIVCLRAINVGEEFTLRYSDEYVDEYITAES
jgi:hypothetical protein